MIINAKVKVKYISDMTFNEDGVYLVITFKEPKKFFKTKIERLRIPRKNDIEFYDKLKYYLSNIDIVKGDVEYLVQTYFERVAEQLKSEGKFSEAMDILREFNKNKIEVQVEVK